MKAPWQNARAVSLGLVLLAGLFSGGCQAPKQSPTFAPLPDDAPRSSMLRYAETNRFAVGDIVIVKFFGTADQIPPHKERIKGDGTITLPLIGSVKAADKSPAGLQQEILELYVPRCFKELAVTVEKEQFYYVGGQVRMPGRQVYLGATTVSQAIQSAGDFTVFALRSRAQLTRAGGKKIVIDCIKAAKDSSQDLPVYPGDRIIVPSNQPSCDYGR